MKVIAVERMWNGDRRIESEALGSERVSDPRKVPMTLIADSAVVRRGMPLFVPDFAGDCSGCCHMPSGEEHPGQVRPPVLQGDWGHGASCSERWTA